MITRCHILTFAIPLMALAAAVACPAHAFTPEQLKNLRLSIVFDKDTYALGEPIVVRVEITNTGKESVTDCWFSYAG